MSEAEPFHYHLLRATGLCLLNIILSRGKDLTNIIIYVRCSLKCHSIFFFNHLIAMTLKKKSSFECHNFQKKKKIIQVLEI